MQMSGSRQVVLSGDPPAKAIYGAFPNRWRARRAVEQQGSQRTAISSVSRRASTP
jgi:hypothetical protein